MADDTICEIPYKGEEYELHPRDITVVKLRQSQAWYGKDYGKYATLMSLFFQGDADAVAVILWIVLAKSGVNRPPQNIDFSPYDIYEAITKANEEKEAALAKEAEADTGADDDGRPTTPAEQNAKPLEPEAIHDGIQT